jgi:galactonate dehydratase
MKITSIRAYPILLPRDPARFTGTAGSPTALAEGVRLQWANSYRTIYSSLFESALIRVDTEEGVTGWGESQAPVAPEVVKAIVDRILAPILKGADPLDTNQAWETMYAAMRARGQTGGFMVDAISGIDIALWDIRGKVAGRPVSSLLSAHPRLSIPVYVSGVAGKNAEEKVQFARGWVDKGARAFKIFLDATEEDCLATIRALRKELGSGVELFVDALWRFDLPGALAFAGKLSDFQVGFLEAPLPPEDVEQHRALTAASPVPIAIGESYRTHFEVLPFLRAGACNVLQPDIGRCGITEGLRIAELARGFDIPVLPHLSIGFGPQIAAALHFAAIVPAVRLLECNPGIYAIANTFLKSPFVLDGAALKPSASPGLGIDWDETALSRVLN